LKSPPSPYPKFWLALVAESCAASDGRTDCDRRIPRAQVESRTLIGKPRTDVSRGSSDVRMYQTPDTPACNWGLGSCFEQAPIGMATSPRTSSGPCIGESAFRLTGCA